MWDELKRAFSPERWILIGVFSVIVLILGFCTIQAVTNRVDRNSTVREQNHDIRAREKADEQRTVDRETIQANTEKLNDIVAEIPASVPSEQRYALACARMRNDSRVKQLPARCRSEAN